MPSTRANILPSPTCRARRRTRGVVLCAVLALTTACAADSDDATSAGTPVASTSTGALPLVGGGTLDLSTIDDRPIALWFWAPG